MTGMHTVKDGNVERFIVEVLAIPGDDGNPTFTVHMIAPGEEIYAQSRTHDKASSLFEHVLEEAKSGLSDPQHDWLDLAMRARGLL